MESSLHQPVLLQEVIKGLGIEPGKKYIDATLGDAGHALEIIKKGGSLLGIDRDAEQISRARARLKKAWSALSSKKVKGQKKPVLILGNFAQLDQLAKAHDFLAPQGILFDLGISSRQLDSGKKGLSFNQDTALDMRLDESCPLSAKDLINSKTEGELYELFIRNVQEELARPIARAIVRARSLKPIETTGELSRIISGVKNKRKKLHPATKIFLALRMEVNAEIDNLTAGLKGALQILSSQGRLAIISFHESEDRIVKKTFKKWQQAEKVRIISKKPILPSASQKQQNPRSRSAKLRIACKI